MGKLLARSLDSSDARLQQEAMRVLAQVVGAVGYAFLKQQLLSRVHQLVMGTTAAAVRCPAATTPASAARYSLFVASF